MPLNNPSIGDICLESLREAGVVGVGMQATKTQLDRSLTRLNWILQQWARRRLMVFSVQTQVINVSAGDYYTVGNASPDFNSDFSLDFATNNAGEVEQSRPQKLEGVFFRQTNVSGQGPIDYPLDEVSDPTDYWTRVRMKSLTSWPQIWCYQPLWPLGQLYIWPKPQVSMGYQLGILFRQPLDISLLNQGTQLSLPPEYQSALMYSLAMELRSAFQIPSYAGDMLPGLYKNAMSVITNSNARIGRLQTPTFNRGRGRYNIYSDNYGR